MRGNRITLESESNGTYQCLPAALDKIIDAYGTDTREEIEREIALSRGQDPNDVKINSRTEGFMILAELNGYATN